MKMTAWESGESPPKITQTLGFDRIGKKHIIPR
jgi:hypothetical protein